MLYTIMGLDSTGLPREGDDVAPNSPTPEPAMGDGHFGTTWQLPWAELRNVESRMFTHWKTQL